ncbi:hypothetical protein MNVI_01190 [Mycobacterium noviomagense]|uniref:Uncharacterized protein n=1 Tax=Mycobacterium noviomagense TaxID=459858 RepID=A0A7I7P7E0_9MYCO|nr:hypothetical protein MNVI_01190 [Mycobacterium noviomagense]
MSRAVREPARQQRVRVTVVRGVVDDIGAAVAVRLSSEASVQPLRGQFCSHAPTVGAKAVITVAAQSG